MPRRLTNVALLLVVLQNSPSSSLCFFFVILHSTTVLLLRHPSSSSSPSPSPSLPFPMSSLHLLPGATTTLNSAFLLHPHSPLFPSKTLTPKKPKPPSALLQWNCKPKPQPKPFCRTYWCTLGIKKSQEFAFIISLNLEARNCSILL